MNYTQLLYISFFILSITTFLGCGGGSGGASVGYTAESNDAQVTPSNNTNTGGGNSSPSSPPAGGGNPPPPAGTTTETFEDSTVSGLEYSYDSVSNTTSSNGSLSYTTGQTVTFKIGKVILGSSSSSLKSGYKFPQDLANVPLVDTNNSKVLNIAILLQSLDSDGDLSNGIDINSSIRSFLDTNLTANETLQNMNSARLSQIIRDCNATEVSWLDARNHLDSTMSRYDIIANSKVAPTIDSVTIPATTYIQNQDINITVNFSETIDINSTNGTPYLSLTIGDIDKNATYLEGNGTNSLIFQYTIENNLLDTDGISLSGSIDLNNSIIQDSDNNNLINSFSSTFTNVLIDSIIPTTIESVTINNDGTHKAGINLDFTVNTSENVDVNTTNGTPRLILDINGTQTHYANYLSGTGSNTLVFRYQVEEDLEDFNGTEISGTEIDFNDGNITDIFLNDLNKTLNTIDDLSGINIDSKAPEFNSAVDTITQCEMRTIDFSIFATDGDGNNPVYDKNGTDTDDFSISGTTLNFGGITNFEAPLDDGGNNIYNITISATDTVGNIATKDMTITVLDKNGTSGNDESNLYLKYVVYNNNLTDNNTSDDTTYIYFSKKIDSTTLSSGTLSHAGEDYNISNNGNINDVDFTYSDNLFYSQKIYDTSDIGTRVAFDINGTSTDTNLSIKVDQIRDWDYYDKCRFYPTDYNQTVASKIEYVLKTNSTKKDSANNGKSDYYTARGVSRDYNTSESGIVIDNITGYIWQDDENVSNKTYDEAVSYCAGINLSGYTWRVPEVNELLTLLDHDIAAGDYRLTPNIFNTYEKDTYWTNNATATSNDVAWYVSFEGKATDKINFISYADKVNTRSVRCIGTAIKENNNNYAYNDNITLESVTIDINTNLMWQKLIKHNEVGKQEDTWAEALRLCNRLNIGGYDDWLLPNIRELQTIVDYDKNDPTLNSDAFVDYYRNKIYWSSTVFVGSGDYALTVNFDNGKSVARDISEDTERYYRCVRTIN